MRRKYSEAIVIALALIFGGILPARADGFGMFDEEFGFGHMFFGGAMMIAFWGAVIVLVVLAVRWLTDSRESKTDSTAPDAPLRVLEQRYARGEIDHDEFDRRRQTLRDAGGSD